MKNLFGKYKENKIEFIFLVALIGCLISQIAITLYFNIFEADIHMGMDSSWEYLKTIIVADNGEIYSPSLISDTTAPWINRSFLLAVPLYMLTGNVFLSYALANFIITVISIFLLIGIMNKRRFNSISILLVLNLFVCPYMLNYVSWHNDLEYYNCVLGVSAFYNVVIMYVLMAYRILLIEGRISKKEKVLVVVSGLLAFVIGLGSGVSMLAIVFVPLACSRIILMFIKNSVDVFNDKKSIFIFSSLVISALGQIVGWILGLQYQDSLATWCSADHFWKNLGNLVVGYMRLFGAIPIIDMGDVSPMSKEGIFYAFAIIICVIVTVAILYTIVKLVQLIKNEVVDEFILTLVTVILSTVFEFILLDTTYGAVFEDRYLIIVLISAFILVGYFVNSLNEKLLLKKVGIVILFVSIVCVNIASDHKYRNINSRDYLMDEMLQLINTNDAGMIYAWGNDTAIYERCLRVYDTDHVYKLINSEGEVNKWGDYLYYDDSTEYIGPTILMISDSELVPKDILSEYQYITTIHSIGFYYCNSNPIDTKKLKN